MPLNNTSLPVRNGSNEALKFTRRADEVEDLLDAVQKLVLPFIRAADDAATKHMEHGLTVPGSGPRTALVEHHKPEKLIKLLDFQLPDGPGKGKQGLLKGIEDVLKFSVNTWDPGFLDKLYSSTNAVGVVSELLLAVLNTNVHVYQVSPALTVIEKRTSRSFAKVFGFTGPHAGGISTQGGSASSTTALVIARNNLYPSTKTAGNESHKFVLFTSAHGHYSFEKAAQMCGFGSSAVVSIEVDPKGCMIPTALEEAVQKAKSAGQTPFFVNATAGTTVLGSYDPFRAISHICKAHDLWLHIDGSWGGPVIFSSIHKYKMDGCHLADSLAVNPHKMMNVPLTCSFLLTNDLTYFHKANTLPAGYLFHADGDGDIEIKTGAEVWDLADLTLQCGRRGDSLKLALSWIYYGTTGYSNLIDNAFSTAAFFASEIASRADFVLLSESPPPCLQVCFYFVPGGRLSGNNMENTRVTREIATRLMPRGFMVDYAPGEKGSFFRVVVNTQTSRETVQGLIKAIEEVGAEVS